MFTYHVWIILALCHEVCITAQGSVVERISTKLETIILAG
jgi:hypothetical protein